MKAGLRRESLKKAGILFLSLVLFGLCSLLIYMTRTAELEAQGEAAGNQEGSEQTLDSQEDGGYRTIAVFGMDEESGGETGNQLAMQMICSVNRADGRVRMLSIYQDSFLQLNNGGTYGKIGEAWLQDGMPGSIRIISGNMDLSIDDYLLFSWTDLAGMIDLLGGIELELTKEEADAVNERTAWAEEAGGLSAETLARTGRFWANGAQTAAYLYLTDSEPQRILRQQKVLEQVIKQAKQLDSQTLLQTAEDILPRIETSISQEELLEMVRNLENYQIDQMGSFPFSYAEADMGQRGMCRIPNTLESNVSELYEFLYGIENYECSRAVKEISAAIIQEAIVNGGDSF